MAAILVLSVMPGSDDSMANVDWFTSTGFEKHAGAYFLAVVLYIIAYSDGKFGRLAAAGFGLFGYGVLLEIIQYTLPYRSFRFSDIWANGIGIAACLVSRKVLSFLKRT